MGAYLFFLNDIMMPVTPGKVTVKYGNKNKRVTLINDEEINIIKTPGLTEISFDLLLPAQLYPFAKYQNNEFKQPIYFIQILNKMKTDKSPIRLKIIRGNTLEFMDMDTYNFKCTIENMSYIEDASDGSDITVSLSLLQYADYQTIQYRKDESNTMTEVKIRPSDKEIPSAASPRSYTVKKGDSLIKICKKEYGDSNRYKEVAEKNNITNPNLIFPGQVILLD